MTLKEYRERKAAIQTKLEAAEKKLVDLKAVKGEKIGEEKTTEIVEMENLLKEAEDKIKQYEDDIKSSTANKPKTEIKGRLKELLND